LFESDDVRRVARIGTNAFQSKVLRPRNTFSKAQRGLSRLNTRSILSNVEIDQRCNLNPSLRSGTLQFVHVLFVVHHDHRVRSFGKDAEKPRDLRLTDHLSCDEQSPNACASHDLGFSYGGNGNADSSFLDLATRNIHALMRLCMRTQ